MRVHTHPHTHSDMRIHAHTHLQLYYPESSAVASLHSNVPSGTSAPSARLERLKSSGISPTENLPGIQKKAVHTSNCKGSFSTSVQLAFSRQKISSTDTWNMLFYIINKGGLAFHPKCNNNIFLKYIIIVRLRFYLPLDISRDGSTHVAV